MSNRAAARHGFWFGIGLFLCGTYWIYLSVTGPGNAPSWIGVLLVVLLTLVMALYLGGTAWLISRLSQKNPWWLLLAAPAAWTLVEWARGWFLSGFPWMSLGYGQIDTSLAGWAPLLGVYGMTAGLVMSASALLLAILLGGRQRWIALSIAVLPWVAGAGLTTVQWTEARGSAIKTTILQAGVSQERKWLMEELEPTKNFYRNQTLAHPSSQLVVWPEVAIPSVTDREAPYMESIQEVSKRNGQAILYGILERKFLPSGEATIYNSVFLADGGDRQVYRKRHLVPFGEYFPVPAKVREWMRMMNLPFSDLSPGSDEQNLLEMADGTKLSVAICYEDSYGAMFVDGLQDAALLINVSNDAWFGNSIAPHQHLQIARMRSLEAGRPTVRATNTGISAFIDADGKIMQLGAQFEPVQMTMDIQPRKGATFYARAGNWPVISLCCFVLLGLWLRSRAS
jgi:apolipoprotein N-acyltransferase